MSDLKQLDELFKDLSLEPVPTSDIEAWVANPTHHEIYNKLWIAETQCIPCGPMGIYPSKYPVIFKPIINLYGMSRGIRIVNNDDEYEKYKVDGMFWSDFLTGPQHCVDLVLVDGKIVYSGALLSHLGPMGSFDYHETLTDYELPDSIRDWISVALDDYTGCVNMDVIGNKIVEVHLRLNGDSQSYDYDFVRQLHAVLRKKIPAITYTPPKIYIIPIFVEKTFDKSINQKEIKSIAETYNINRIGFDDINAAHQSEHFNRLAIFDTPNLDTGLEFREKIIELCV